MFDLDPEEEALYKLTAAVPPPPLPALQPVQVIRPASATIQQQAFQDYLDLGPQRSVMGLWNRYHNVTKKDPTAWVPSHDQHQLLLWEAEGSWREKALQYDQQSTADWQRNRDHLVAAAFDRQLKLADQIIEVAEKRLTDTTVPLRLDAKDVVKYLQVGNQMRVQAVERKLELTNPAGNQGHDNSVFELMITMVTNKVQARRALEAGSFTEVDPADE